MALVGALRRPGRIAARHILADGACEVAVVCRALRRTQSEVLDAVGASQGRLEVDDAEENIRATAKVVWGHVKQ